MSKLEILGHNCVLVLQPGPPKNIKVKRHYFLNTWEGNGFLAFFFSFITIAHTFSKLSTYWTNRNYSNAIFSNLKKKPIIAGGGGVCL